jgi:pimeloyl-ACP methyl ester carboxylesterase
MNAPPLRVAETPRLAIAYEEHGPADGPAAVLLHGFPYDPRAYDGVAPALAAAGLRVIVPYLRGYGPTRYAGAAIPRSGEQAALGADLKALMHALGIARARLGGYDWGGRAACVVAALWPERVSGLVSCTGYNIQDIAGAARPLPPEQEHRYWYQYYFHTPRGEAGLAADRRAIARLLWRLWSPSWRFAEADFAATAPSFDNPDFVATVIHSYRHRFGYAAGDPAHAAIETALARRPAISAPTIDLHGADDGVAPAGAWPDQRRNFAGSYERRVIPGVGHNVPQEAPDAFARAMLELPG